MKVCPFCGEPVDELIDHEGEMMCDECFEFMVEKDQSQINDESGFSDYCDGDL